MPTEEKGEKWHELAGMVRKVRDGNTEQAAWKETEATGSLVTVMKYMGNNRASGSKCVDTFSSV